MDNTIHMAPSIVAYTELGMALLIGIIIGALIGAIITAKIIEKRFPMKIRKVNQLKKKYLRQIEKVKHREGIIYFLYNLTSQFLEQIAKKIKEIESTS